MVRPMSAQEEHNEAMAEVWERMKKETPEQRKQARSLLEGFLQENEETSSRGTSSLPRDLVEDVMQTYGFTREKAEEEIEKFGG